VTKSFPGASIEDMEDFIRPITRKQPENIVLHIGTNDLRSSQSAQQIAESIVNLADQVQSDSPSTQVSISAILFRRESELWTKAQEVNKLLRRFCNNRGWDFILNDNIDAGCLNRGGLHLNLKGVRELSSNYSTHIDSKLN